MNQLIKKMFEISILLVVIVFFFMPVSEAKESNYVSYSTIDVRNGGTISGLITFTGQIPAIKEIKVNKDKKVCGNHKAKETLVVDTNSKGIKNAVVYLKEIRTGKKWEITENSIAMDQKGCMFSPHVIVVPAGQKFNMLNNDGILHNVHTRSEINAEINKAQPKFLKRLKLSFEEPEFIKVTCDVHNWMQGWIIVAEHPYYTITDDTGKFELNDVPAGSYTMEIWHESLGQQSKQVEVKAGEAVRVDVPLK